MLKSATKKKATKAPTTTVYYEPTTVYYEPTTQYYEPETQAPVGYIDYSGASTRYFDESDVAGLSADTVQSVINDIYAHHGYIFKTASIQAYYESQSWYKGTVNSQSDAEKSFNDYENYNKNEYIYDLFGNLYEVKILTGDENIRPYFKATYSNTGYLQKVNFFAEDGFEYIFYADGKLQGVVVNDKLYNSIGRPVKVWLL